MRLWTKIKRWFQPRKPDVVLSLTADEKAVLEFWAYTHAMSLEVFMKNAALNAIPATERAKFFFREKLGEVMDASFGMIDDEDGTVLPLRRATPLVIDALPKNHVCAYLDESVTSLGPHLAHGVCKHHSQRGRACFWPPAAAHDCPVFRLGRLHRTA